MDNQNIERNIHHYLAGRLTASERDILWDQIIQDPDQYEYFLTELHLKKYFEDQKPVAKPIPLRTWTLIAAALATIVIGLQFLRYTEDDYLSRLSLQKVDDSSFESVTAFRDGENELSYSDSLLALALDQTYSGRFDEAINNYNKLIENQPEGLNSAKAHLNLGIIFYNRGQFQKAITEFDSSLMNLDENNIFTEKIFWLKSNAHFNLKQYELARDAVKSAFERNGIYQDDALELYRYLEYKLGYSDYEPVEGEFENYENQKN